MTYPKRQIIQPNQEKFFDISQETLDLFPQEFKIAIITSVRDIVADDRNGQHLPNGNYMMGVPEALLRNPIQNAEIVGIITDDTETDGQKGRLLLENEPIARHPNDQGLWLMSKDIRMENGTLATTHTSNIPSEFRHISKKYVDERRYAKETWEHSILEFVKQMGANVILSDHLMVIVTEKLIEHMRNCVLNIHPAVTQEGYPYIFRGATPTADSLQYARQNTNQSVYTGATLHFVDPGIDTGEPIHIRSTTLIDPHLDPNKEADRMSLRYTNYQEAKIPTVRDGLSYLLTQIERSLSPQSSI